MTYSSRSIVSERHLAADGVLLVPVLEVINRSMVLERHLAAEGVHLPREQREGQRRTVEHLEKNSEKNTVRVEHLKKMWSTLKKLEKTGEEKYIARTQNCPDITL